MRVTIETSQFEQEHTSLGQRPQSVPSGIDRRPQVVWTRQFSRSWVNNLEAPSWMQWPEKGELSPASVRMRATFCTCLVKDAKLRNTLYPSSPTQVGAP